MKHYHIDNVGTNMVDDDLAMMMQLQQPVSKDLWARQVLCPRDTTTSKFDDDPEIEAR